ncbi:MAG TPA: V-type ATP synthase subunit E [Coriobacteriia bacterium]
MAIEDILKALDEQAQADCDAVLEEAREHARLILEEGEREAQQIHDGFSRQAERVATLQAAKEINAARLESKMTVSSVKGDAVVEVFDSALDRLPELRSSGAYEALFSALAKEAFAGLEGPVIVQVAPADAALASRAAEAAGLSATVDPTLETAGGLVVEAYGGRVVRRNTLEDRLDRTRQILQSDVAKVLFS